MFKRKTRDGLREDTYSIQWTDESGRRIGRRVSADKSVAEAALAGELLRVERRKAGLPDPVSAECRENLSDLAAAFVRSLEADNRSERYVSITRTRLTRLLSLMAAHQLSDYRLGAAQEALARLLDDGASARTRDHYAALGQQFGRWLVRTDRLPRNPLQSLSRVFKPADAKVVRYALEPEQIPMLLSAAVERPVEGYRSRHPNAPASLLADLAFEGRCRAVIYALAATSGLRRGEIETLRWSDLRLGEHPSVTIRAEVEKSGRGATLPLIQDTATLLQNHLSRVHERTGRMPNPDDRVVRMPDAIPDRLRDDARWASIRVPDNLKLDLHALRTTYATSLARAGVPVQTACKLLRHSDVRITMDVYTKLNHHDLVAGQAQLAMLLGSGVTALVTASDRLTPADTGLSGPKSHGVAEGGDRG